MDKNRPAFAQPLLLGVGEPQYSADVSGMSLREWYAGRALTGLLVSDYGNPVEASEETRLATARVAFAYADAMVKAGAE